jgi:hypothetical protein
MIVLDAQELGIPTLDPALQAAGVPTPVYPWGSRSRRLANPGTYHFYTPDFLFNALWSREGSWAMPVRTGVRCLVEPNFSTYVGQPDSEVLWATYRKRVISRRWQEEGVPILVDLNVGGYAQQRINLLGVPKGWRSYATRSHRETGIDGLNEDHDAAIEHAGTMDVLFAVFGGGMATREACEDNGWTWVPEHSDVVRGRPPRVRRDG